MDKPTSERLVSLDAFRGLTIAGMILVNNPGTWEHVYPQLLHAEWHGWTFTDLIFPFFLFIVGVAIAFSLPKQLERLDRADLYRKILRRAVVLFGLGLLLNVVSPYALSELRVAGVLQRIAIVYLITALLMLQTSRRTQGGVLAGLLLGYWALMTLVPVSTCGAGVLTPECSLASWIDRNWLPGRLWPGMYDPEGILSTLPAIGTALIGVFTGYWLRSARPAGRIAAGMLAAGLLLTIVGLLWDLVFPINKNLWTSSYVVFTAGGALIALAICYRLIDVRGHTRWAKPAVVLGLNAIAVYVLSSLMAKALFLIEIGPGGTPLKAWIYNGFFAPLGPPMATSLLFAVVYLSLWWVLMGLLYKRGIFIKI